VATLLKYLSNNFSFLYYLLLLLHSQQWNHGIFLSQIGSGSRRIRKIIKEINSNLKQKKKQKQLTHN